MDNFSPLLSEDGESKYADWIGEIHYAEFFVTSEITATLEITIDRLLEPWQVGTVSDRDCL